MGQVVISKEIGDGTPVAEGTSAVAGRVCFLDTGVPWLRTGAELEREWKRLRPVIEPVFTKVRIAPDTASFTSGERHTMGSYATAMWTLGGTTEVPLGRAESPVTGRAIRQQLATAHDTVESRCEGWEFALGVMQWLLWITSGSEKPPNYFR
jgi:hypothetical protein